MGEYRVFCSHWQGDCACRKGCEKHMPRKRKSVVKRTFSDVWLLLRLIGYGLRATAYWLMPFAVLGLVMAGCHRLMS